MSIVPIVSIVGVLVQATIEVLTSSFRVCYLGQYVFDIYRRGGWEFPYSQVHLGPHLRAAASRTGFIDGGGGGPIL